MQFPTVLDFIVLGIPLLCGLLGMRAGLRLALVSWPIRWLVSLIGAQALLILIASLAFSDAGIRAQILALDPLIQRGIGIVLYLVLLAVLLAVTRSIRRRVLYRVGDDFVGPVETTLGGLFGIAGGFGVVLCMIVVPYVFLESMQPDRSKDPGWIRDALSLPYIKSAGDGIKSTVMSYLPAEPRPKR